MPAVAAAPRAFAIRSSGNVLIVDGETVKQGGQAHGGTLTWDRNTIFFQSPAGQSQVRKTNGNFRVDDGRLVIATGL